MSRKNSQKRIYLPEAIYFITINTRDRYPFFKEEIFCNLFIKELELTKDLKRFKLFGFVILPNHSHLLIQPNDKYNISQIIKSLKENTSRDINYIILNTRNAGDTSTCRLRIRGLIINFQNKFIKKYGQNQHQSNFPKFKWQKSFHDHIIRDEEDLGNHLEYIWYNPVKHNLSSEDYKFSSFKNYKNLIDLYPND
ncbi:transposase [Candidatus Falkowbacteria bacterium]|nr:transposase [Candidatus Falkowbacteria bacterium]